MIGQFLKENHWKFWHPEGNPIGGGGVQYLDSPWNITGCQVDQLPTVRKERLEPLSGLDLAAETSLAIMKRGIDVAKGPTGQQVCNLGRVAAALAVVAAFQEACDVGQIERAICAVSSVRGRNDAALFEVAYAARRETGQFGHDAYFEIHPTPPVCRWRMFV